MATFFLWWVFLCVTANGLRVIFKECLNNPVYTGMASFPRIIDDETWINAQVISSENNGSRQTLIGVRKRAPWNFGKTVPSMSRETWVEDAIRDIDADGAAQFFRGLLTKLRAELD